MCGNAEVANHAEPEHESLNVTDLRLMKVRLHSDGRGTQDQKCWNLYTSNALGTLTV